MKLNDPGGLLRFLIALVVVVYSGISLLLFIEQTEKKMTAGLDQVMTRLEPVQKNDPEPAVESEPVRLAFVGDIMMDRGVRQMVKVHGGGDYGYITKYLDFFNDFDLVFANLEGPISDRGQDLGNLYSFRMEPETLSALTAANFSVLSVANNHAGDWGREAFKDTLDRLAESGVTAVGGGRDLARATAPAVVETEGLSFGFLGFTDLGPSWLEAKAAQAGWLRLGSGYHDRVIEQAAGQVDVLVVSYHYGEEYQSEPNQRQRQYSERAIDLGADIVAGHHPHVIQPVELYNGGVIAYSLGNFIFDQYFSAETMEGLVLVVEVLDGELSDVSTLEVELTDHYQPRLREQLRYPDLIRGKAKPIKR